MWAWWLSWLEPCPVHQRVVGLIPDQGTYPGCWFNPSQGMCRRQLIEGSLSHWCFSKINKILRWGFNNSSLDLLKLCGENCIYKSKMLIDTSLSQHRKTSPRHITVKLSEVNHKEFSGKSGRQWPTKLPPVAIIKFLSRDSTGQERVEWNIKNSERQELLAKNTPFSQVILQSWKIKAIPNKEKLR